MTQSKQGGIRGRLRKGLSAAVGRLAGKGDRSKPTDLRQEAVVVFRNADGEVLSKHTVAQGTAILEACQHAKIDLDHFCGGQCSCGTCRIIVISGQDFISRIEPKEELVLGAKNQAKGCRLACQAKILGPVELQIPRWF